MAAMKSVHLEKDSFYYIAETFCNLFGEIVVVLRWGSLKTKWERRKEILVRTEGEASLVVAAAVMKKRRGGYSQK